MTKCNNMILPKIWLAWIQQIWENKIPTDYPKTSSEFDFIKDPKMKQVVTSMEDKLGTEESIIVEDMIPENKIIGGYMGTYDVSGVPGELVLLSPNKVSDSTVDIIAMHYNEESDTWEKIEDAKIINGYVYGTLSSFSPIAVFTIKRDTYLVPNCELTGVNTFVANGIGIAITTTEDGKIIVTDDNGKVTEIDNNTAIIGGTIDGSDIDSTSIFINKATVLTVYGGSFSSDEIAYVNDIKVIVKDSVITKNVTGAGPNCRAKNCNINMANSKANFVGCGQSYWVLKRKDTNNMNNMTLGANTWVKYAKLYISNCTINVLYGAGTSGYLYTMRTELDIIGGKYQYVTAAGSNGKTDNAKVTISGANINVLQSTNRGIVDSANISIKNSTAKVLAVAGDPTDNTVDGSINKVKLSIIDGQYNLYIGTNKGLAISKELAKEIVEFVKVGRSTNIAYMNNAKAILDDRLRLK